MAIIYSSFLLWAFIFPSRVVWSKGCVKVGPCNCSRGIKPTIDCSKRKLTEIPNLSSFPAEAVKVNLEGNFINRLYLNDGVELENVETLNMDKNYIRDLDLSKITKSFPGLSNLALRHNLIEDVFNEGSEEKGSVLMINLGNNVLKSVSDVSFRGLIHLQYLYLDNNRIHSIYKRAFTSLKSLKRLWLQFNQIMIVQSVWFNNLKSIESLQLSDNKITEFLPEGEFEWPPSLYELKLNRNSLKILPPLPHGPKKNARIEDWNVDVQNNPLYCGCRSYGYSLSYLQQVPLCNLKLVCTAPPQMAYQSALMVMEKCNVTLVNSFWKVYTKMDACHPPRITRFESDVDIDKLVCTGHGSGKLTMQIWYLITNQVIKTSTKTVNSTTVMQIRITIIKQAWLRCLIKSDQGNDFRDIFYTPKSDQNETICVKGIPEHNKTALRTDTSSHMIRLPSSSVHVNILGMAVASISFIICLLLGIFVLFIFLEQLFEDPYLCLY